MKRFPLYVLTLATVGWVGLRDAAPESETERHITISWGYQSSRIKPFYLRLWTNGLAVTDLREIGFEAEDGPADGGWATSAGNGDVDGIDFKIHFPPRSVVAATNVHRIWMDLIAQSDPETARRLRQDPAYRNDPRLLTIQTDRDGTQGFSVTVDQLIQQAAFWVPSLDIFVASGDPLVSFDQHQHQLASRKGRAVLDQVHAAPDASYAEFVARWEDMGHPGYRNPAQTGTGHIVGLTWDSAIHKFGIDRGASVRNDLGNPDRFRLALEFADPSHDLLDSWRGQSLFEGLPIITTRLADSTLQVIIDQFAYPLDGPPMERQGGMPMVLLEKISVHNTQDQNVATTVKFRHDRLLPGVANLALQPAEHGFLLQDESSRSALLALLGTNLDVRLTNLPDQQAEKSEPPGALWKAAELEIPLNLPAKGSQEFLIALPSPAVPLSKQTALLSVPFSKARDETVRFWSDYLERGARFQVPEAAVNELFRANLWHALRLPRRHGGNTADQIDLPYSNFAYGQQGTPWPVNQAVYVDYMLYDLRGYPELSFEELQAIYRNNQEASGHVGGFANWVVYTPGMIYAVAKHYLLSGDRSQFEALLPPTLKALDWCLSEIEKGRTAPGGSAGLVRGPLNDLTGEGAWAFNQAYVYAGLDVLGKALAQIGHARARECQAGAAAFRRSIERAFGAASMRSPLVELRNGTWSPYVPCEAASPHRLLQQWYPTDVDTGATHLLRLGALAPDTPLADSLLNDHEDNLYLHGWGMANEPVYNQQATAYLLRDDAKAAIRAFYSMTACAFSHSVFEPVEHRWTWGQYFGPPSTDGAWFELYRQMLIRELDDDTLLLLPATPRKWLDDGQKIEVERAPTYFGKISLAVQSHSADGKLLAEMDLPDRVRPKAVLLRLRHPQNRKLQTVTLNGRNWTDFDVEKEWIRIPHPEPRHYSVIAGYSSPRSSAGP
jgi:hypothetical protein